MNKTAEEIFLNNYNSFIGTRFSCANWPELNKEGNLVDCVKLSMKEYAAQFAAPPPASEGEIADSKKVFDALVAIANNERLIADSVGDPILREMHLETQKAAQRICRTIYGATLPTREPEAIKILPKNFKIITIAEDGSAILQYSPII